LRNSLYYYTGGGHIFQDSSDPRPPHVTRLVLFSHAVGRVCHFVDSYTHRQRLSLAA
jgi:hypothetical protein